MASWRAPRASRAARCAWWATTGADPPARTREWPPCSCRAATRSVRGTVVLRWALPPHPRNSGGQTPAGSSDGRSAIVVDFGPLGVAVVVLVVLGAGEPRLRRHVRAR